MKRFGAFLIAATVLLAAPTRAAVTSLSADSNDAYLADYAKQPGVVKLPSGLIRASDTTKKRIDCSHS